MKVLHVISGLTAGGAELAMARLVVALKEQGVDGEVVCMGPSGGAAEVLRAAGVPVHFLGMRHRLALPLGLWKLRALVQDVRPDVLHGWLYQGCLTAALTALRVAGTRRLPVVWGIRQTLEFPLREGFSDRMIIRLCRLLSRSAAAIVYNSRSGASRHAAYGFAIARAHVIANGFETRRFRPMLREEKAAARRALGLDPAALVATAAGRSHPVKDHGLFVRAAVLVSARFPDARFVLVGRHLDEADHPVRALARSLGAEGIFLFRGEQKDIERWLGVSDVVVSSSARSEAFPNVLGEAMACGVPCVATAVGDTAVMLGDAGITVPPGDAEALAAALQKMFALAPEARAAQGARGRGRVMDLYTLERFAAEHAALYGAVYRETVAKVRAASR